jgi:hypothetical protein
MEPAYPNSRRHAVLHFSISGCQLAVVGSFASILPCPISRPLSTTRDIKVGRIDLHAGEGQGLDALLTRLVRLKASETA